MKALLRKLLPAAGAGLFWLAVWSLLAALVGKELLLPSPGQVLRCLVQLAAGAEFWRTVFRSIFRVLSGILAATVLGVLLAALTERSRVCRLLLAPLMTVVKSTPVASFIILALIWLGRDILPVVITGLMVLPVVWANVSAGIAGQDGKLLEMAAVYRMSRWGSCPRSFCENNHNCAFCVATHRSYGSLPDCLRLVEDRMNEGVRKWLLLDIGVSVSISALLIGLSRWGILRHITVPSVLPHFRAALSSALGLGWRAGIAAEVLTVPQLSIGKRIFEAKLYLETTELFAWTLTVILLSLLIERVLLRLVRAEPRRGGESHA